MILYSFRIKITGPIERDKDSKPTERKPSEKKSSERKPAEKKPIKNWSEKLGFTSGGASEKVKEDVELDGGVVGGDGGVTEQEEAQPRILMVRTENLTHNPFEQTRELKVRRCDPCQSPTNL